MNLKALVLTCCATTLSLAAFGQTSYASRTQTIHAGVLLIPSYQNGSGYNRNDAPFVWNNLNQNTLVKPATWKIENPLAPSTVSTATAARWNSLDASANLTAGTAITKAQAAYWEVDLDSSTNAQMSQYDALFLPAYGNLQLTPSEREKLRQFVDQGGILWVDTASTTVVSDRINGLPTPFALSSSSGSRSINFFSALMNQPNVLDSTDLSLTETDTTVFQQTTLAAGIDALYSSLISESGRLQAVSTVGGFGTLGYSQIGNGFLLVTARGSGKVLNMGYDSTAQAPSANRKYYSLDPLFGSAMTSAAKLAVNALSLNSYQGQSQQGTRANHALVTDFGAPLLPSFETPAATLNTPVFHKGYMVVTDSATLYLYSAKPGTILDNSGSTDVGVADYAFGSSYDLVWKVALANSPLSSPICIDVPEASKFGLPTTQILVVDNNGLLHCYDPSFRPTTGVPTPPDLYGSGSGIQPSVGPSAGNSGRGLAQIPWAPTYHDGVIYVADSQGGSKGRLWAVDPARGTLVTDSTGLQFVLGGNGAPVFPEFSGPPTVGYIPIQDNSGGLDKVAYLPTYASTSGARDNAAIHSIWVGAKGELHNLGTGPQDFSLSGGVLNLPTRISQQGAGDVYLPSSSDDPLGVRVVFQRADGTLYTDSDVATHFPGTWTVNGTGALQINYSGSISDIAQIRVDYTIDWGLGATYSSSIDRGRLALIDDSSHQRSILGALTLTPSGNIVAVLSSGAAPRTSSADLNTDKLRGGSVYCFKEVGRGRFQCLYRFEAYDRITIASSSSSSGYGPAFVDGQAQVASTLSGDITNLTFTGPAAYRNGQILVPASGYRNASDPSTANWTPVSLLIALKSDPDPIVILTPDLQPNFTIRQPDVTGSDVKSLPSRFGELRKDDFQYNKNSGEAFGTIRIDSVMGQATSGALVSALSGNLPILIHQPDGSDVQLEPLSTAGSSWNPLLWYATVPGYQLGGAPFITGDTVFLGGTSVLSNMVKGIGSIWSSPQAAVVGLSAFVNPGDTSTTFSPETARPWNTQVYSLYQSGSSVVSGPNFLWPTGFTDVNSLWSRLDQNQLIGSTTVNSVSGGGGVLAVTGDGKLYAYDGSQLVVADAGRLVTLSPGGVTTFTSEATGASATARDVGSASQVRDLIAPTRSYAIGSSDTLIVDAGSNRLIRMDKAGREIRSIDSILLDSGGYRPADFRAGESLHFNRPNDVAIYDEYVTAAKNKLTNPQPYEYWVHLAVADTGNGRLVELVDRYVADANFNVGGPVKDAAGVAQVGVLLGHSPAQFSGPDWTYNSVARIQVDNSPQGSVDTDPTQLQSVLIAGVGTKAASPSDLVNNLGILNRDENSGNGSILIFNGSNTLVLNDFAYPAIPANVLYSGGSFSSPATDARQKKIVNLTSLTASHQRSAGYPYLMFTDATGVYELVCQFNSSGARQWVLNWMLPNQAYTAMRGVNARYTTTGTTGLPTTTGAPDNTNPLGLRANFARRLSSNQILLVNGYVGTTKGGSDFKGEVVIVDGTLDTTNNSEVAGFNLNKVNFGFGTLSVRYQLPPVSGSRSLFAPVFADRR